MVVLVIVFGVMEPDSFLTEQNFANLINQGAAIMVLAMGLVFVLLLGEIDLSAGFTAGTGAAILGVTLTEHGWAWPLAVLAALATGVAIGFTIALLVARLGIPSFVVTLAFFLGLQGAMLLIIGEGGTIPIRNDAILAIMNKNMPVGARLAARAGRDRRLRGVVVSGRSGRRQQGRAADAGAVGVGGEGRRAGGRRDRVVYLLNQERQRPNAPIVIQGVPWVVPLVVVLVVGLTFLLMRTGFGRHVYAVGGNAEAARRAGISVPNIKTICFILCSTLAVVAGILLASRDNSVSPTTGGAQTLLYAVGAAVIGGTSLFGGRGKIYRRGHRRPGGGDHRQRPAAGHPEVGRAVHHQRPRAAARRQRRRHLPQEGGRNRQMIRWGILSTARIADRILEGARLAENAEIVAVGSRDLARAQAYAAEHGIARAHGSYEDAARRPRGRRGLHPAAELDARRVVDPRARGRQARAVREAARARPGAGRARRSTPPSAPAAC